MYAAVRSCCAHTTTQQHVDTGSDNVYFACVRVRSYAGIRFSVSVLVNLPYSHVPSVRCLFVVCELLLLQKYHVFSHRECNNNAERAASICFHLMLQLVCVAVILNFHTLRMISYVRFVDDDFSIYFEWTNK